MRIFCTSSNKEMSSWENVLWNVAPMEDDGELWFGLTVTYLIPLLPLLELPSFLLLFDVEEVPENGKKDCRTNQISGIHCICLIWCIYITIRYIIVYKHHLYCFELKNKPFSYTLFLMKWYNSLTPIPVAPIPL